MRRSRADAIKVGLFVVVAGATLLGGLAWIAGSRLFRPVDTYTVLFGDSVSGMNAGANVEYQGVVVGRVRDIQLTGDIPPKVAVIVDIEPGTPVRKDTVAALVGSLVTGIKFIQFQGGSEAAEPLEQGGLIRGDVSSLEQFRDQLAEVANRVVNVVRRLDSEVFTPENSTKVSAFVQDMGTIAKSLSGTLETFQTEETGKDVAQLVRQLSEVTTNLNAVVSDFYGRRDKIFGNVETTLRHIDETVTETRDLVRGAQSQLAGTGGSLSMLLGNLAAATNRLEETLDMIRSDPSMLLWGRSVPEREHTR